MTRFLLALVFPAALLVLPACNQDPAYWILKVQVVDRQTRAPLAKIGVRCEPRLSYRVTPPSGKVEFSDDEAVCNTLKATDTLAVAPDGGSADGGNPGVRSARYAPQEVPLDLPHHDATVDITIEMDQVN